MKTILEVLNLSTDFLNGKGVMHARRAAQDLIADALAIKPMDIYLFFDRPLDDRELSLCREKLMRRSKGEPEGYIRGYAEFLSCRIFIDSRVLIPRQETEILASKIVAELEQDGPLKGRTLWDVCSGSGCLGIALKKRFPDLRVILSDISRDALIVAAENARQNEVAVELKEGNFLDPLKGSEVEYIVCNPPYISDKEFEKLEKEVKEFEPKLALVSGATGLEYYQLLAQGLPFVLTPGGKAWLELGSTQGEAVVRIFEGGPWKKKVLENDWSGLNRFFSLERES